MKNINTLHQYELKFLCEYQKCIKENYSTISVIVSKQNKLVIVISLLKLRKPRTNKSTYKVYKVGLLILLFHLSGFICPQILLRNISNYLDKLGKQAKDFSGADYIDLPCAPTEEILPVKWKFPLDSRNV